MGIAVPLNVESLRKELMLGRSDKAANGLEVSSSNELRIPR